MSLLLAIIALLSGESIAQTVQVDSNRSHVVNKFSPLYALGTSVDRVPSNATDVFFSPGPTATGTVCRLGQRHLPAEHRVIRASLALEPEGDME